MSQTIIQVDHLSKQFRVPQKNAGVIAALKNMFRPQYNMVDAVQDISFQIDEGEVVGFIGPNGAGKTTTLKMLTGLLYPTSGKVEVLGHSPFKRDPKLLSQFTLVMGQKNQLWWNLPPIDSFKLFKEMYSVSDEKYTQTVNELSELLEITDVLTTPVRKLSLGQRMKAELVASLLHNPRLLFLDEPTIGLDVVMQKAVRDFLKAYNEKYNAAILLTSHYMEDVKFLCHRVIVINHGRIVFDGAIQDMMKTYVVDKTIKIVTQDEKKFAKIKSFLSTHCEVHSAISPELIATVPSTKSAHIARTLISDYGVDDLELSEPNLEEIVRRFFSDNNRSDNNKSDNRKKVSTT